MKNNMSDEYEPDLQENSDNIAVASMIEKLQSLKEVASKNGFKVLVYMLDMARVEAESLRKDGQ